MKKNIQFTFCFAVILFLMFSCKKQELAVAKPPKVVSLLIKGFTVTDTLEFVKDGKLIAKTSTNNGDFRMEAKILVTDGGAEIQIRRKGHTEILERKTILADLAQQNIDCYFDGDKVYNNSVTLKIKGYALADVLEFVLDGKVIGSGTGNQFPDLSIGVNGDQTRQLQIRKKDGTVNLLTKDILAGQATQSMSFFYDGTKVFDKIDLTAPTNPANMAVNASFTSKVNVFDGPVDVVFYQGKLGQNTYEFTATEIRFELPADGTFSKNIELPPLPESGTTIKNVYSFKLVKRGTNNDLPYNLTNELKPIRPESGFCGSTLVFTGGGSAVLVLSDDKKVKTTGAPSGKGTTFVTNVTDIAQFFK